MISSPRFLGVAFASLATVSVTVMCGVGGAIPAGAASKPAAASSKFVSLADSNCKSTGESAEEDTATLLCKGTIDGWSVIIEYGDARDSVALRRGGKVTQQHFESTVTGYFSAVGDKYEFRVKSNKAIGTIVRVVHDLNGESPETKVSVLVVSRLSPTPCVIAVVQPGSKQATTARTLADASSGKPCRTSTE